MKYCVLVSGHDSEWLEEDMIADYTSLGGSPVMLVESENEELIEISWATGRRIAAGDRKDLVFSYLNNEDPGRVSVRKELLEQLENLKNGTHVQKNAAIDAVLADIRT